MSFVFAQFWERIAYMGQPRNEYRNTPIIHYSKIVISLQTVNIKMHVFHVLYIYSKKAEHRSTAKPRRSRFSQNFYNILDHIEPGRKVFVLFPDSLFDFEHVYVY